MEVCDIIRQSPEGISPFSHLTKDTPEGLIIEFGVSDGGSLGSLAGVASSLNRKVYGFDWFKGLPEEWGPNKVGTFSTQNGRAPHFNQDNIELVVGLFQDTLPGFLTAHPEPMAFVHIDSDIYSAASFILEHIEKRLQPGTVLAFDELIDYHCDLPEDNYGHWRNGEYKAFLEMIERTNIKWKCLSRYAPHQVAIEIL